MKTWIFIRFHQISSDFQFFNFGKTKWNGEKYSSFFVFKNVNPFSKVASWIWLMYWYFGSRLNLEQATKTTTNNTPTTTATQISTATKQINVRLFSSETSFLPIHGPLKKGNGSQEIGNDTTEDFRKRSNQKAFGKRYKDKALENGKPQKTIPKKPLKKGDSGLGSSKDKAVKKGHLKKQPLRKGKLCKRIWTSFQRWPWLRKWRWQLGKQKGMRTKQQRIWKNPWHLLKSSLCGPSIRPTWSTTPKMQRLCKKPAKMKRG